MMENNKKMKNSDDYLVLSNSQRKKFLDILSKLFPQTSPEDWVNIEDIYNKDLVIFDPYDVYCVVIKSYPLKLLAIPYSDKNKNSINIELKPYKDVEKGIYNTKYVYLFSQTFNIFEKNRFEMQCGSDYPLIMENEHIKFLLAPIERWNNG